MMVDTRPTAHVTFLKKLNQINESIDLQHL